MSTRVSSAFDGGNIEVVDEASDPIRLRIRPDAGGRFLQWFYFRVTTSRGTPLTLAIENAGETTYREGWRGYQAVASIDRERWVRVPTEYDGRALTIRHTPAADAVWYAYFAPYSLERHQDLIARCQRDPRAKVDVLGTTLDGHELDRVRVGEGPRTIWAIARQHPGETMAEWLMEGFLARLLEREDLHAKATFHVVPNMNPDGSRRGHLRSNACGTNLNRAWLDPSPSASPEVLAVRDEMHRTGVDLCLDVHGDEEIPHNFVSGPEGVPSFSAHQAELYARFKRGWAAIDPAFQIEHGYPPSPPGGADLRLCTNYVAETFGCLAVTLEQPFKDAASQPMPETGWSPDRASALGASAVSAIARVIDDLRA